jgi:HEPN domain-containing protein
MNKPDYIDYWKITAENDWVAVYHLFEKGDFLQSLFFANLVLEKLLKAHWVKDNIENVPPKIHRLTYLLSHTKLILTHSDVQLLDDMDLYQLGSRYPDYHFKISKLCTQPHTEALLKKVLLLKDDLLKKLP